MSDATVSPSQAGSPMDIGAFLADTNATVPEVLEVRVRALTERAFRKEIDAVVAELPDSPGSARAHGVAALLIGKNHRASDQLGKAGKDPRTRHLLGRALIGAGRFDEAAEVLAELEKSEPNSRPAHAEALLRASDPGAAGKVIGKLLKDDRESAEGDFLNGYRAELSGEYDEAYAAYRAALEKNPAHGKSAFRLAYMLDLDGNEDDAVEIYEQLRRQKPTLTNALVNLGVLYEDRGEYTKAVEVYQEIIDIYPNHARARRFIRDARASLNMYYDEDLERTEDRRAQILRIPISDFELSVRSRNCLAKMQIETLGDLIKKTEPELLSYKNFGETSLQEIKDILAQKGLRLGMGREEQTASVQAAARTLLGIEPEKGDVHSKDIEELELSVRSRNAMKLLGIATLGDLAKLSEKDLMQVKNFGQTSMNEVKEKLAEFGLSLAPSQPD